MMAFDIDDDIRRDETDELHGIGRSWFKTAVPVTAQPHGPEIRSAVAELIRDYSPIVLRDFRVEFQDDSWVTVSAEMPATVPYRVHRELYLDESEVQR